MNTTVLALSLVPAFLVLAWVLFRPHTHDWQTLGSERTPDPAGTGPGHTTIALRCEGCGEPASLVVNGHWADPAARTVARPAPAA